MKLHVAAVVGTILFAGVAGAATSYPIPAPPVGSQPSASGPHLDFTSCPLADAKAADRARIEASLNLPDSERGKALASGPCSVASDRPGPARADERYRR